MKNLLIALSAFLCVMGQSMPAAASDDADMRLELLEIAVDEACRYSCRNLSWHEAQANLKKLIRELKR